MSEKLVSLVANSKAIDSTYFNDFKELKFTLKDNLHPAKTLDSSFINIISTLNNRLIGLLSRLLIRLTENEQSLRSSKDFKDFQTLLMNAENRIFIAQKQYIEDCEKANRKDLIYKRVN